MKRSITTWQSTLCRCAVALTLGVAGCLITVNRASAKDSTGVVTMIAIDETSGVRVKVSGVSTFCDGGATTPAIAFLALTFPLYQDILKTLTAAYLSGMPITVRANKDGSYCKIFGLIWEK